MGVELKAGVSRDSKVIVADYDLGGLNLLYSTAEIFTWKKYDDRTVLVLYGAIGEAHEAALITDERLDTVEGEVITSSQGGDTLTFNWAPSKDRSVVKVGKLVIYLLDRNSAYQYFVPVLPSDKRGAYGTSETNPDAVIVRAGYLVRSAQIADSTLKISADFNKTTEVEIIGSPSGVSTLEINGNRVETITNKAQNLQTEVKYNSPEFNVPDLSQVTWKYINALPEIKAGYDDSAWVKANRRQTNNTFETLKTPTVLYSGEYGFHTGYLIYRGHFVASGNEKAFNVTTVGGAAFGSSVWLNETYLGSWQGDVSSDRKAIAYHLPSLTPGKPYVLSVVVDNNGYEMNFEVGVDSMKTPRGITEFALGANNQTRINWKVTGNLGGEDYQDHTRGPKNEGGSYPERQGWHQPEPPSSDWKSVSPMRPTASGPGLAFYTTEFELSMPDGWDIPLSVEFARTSTPAKRYRVQLFVNGWQFGKHNGHLGPQTSFPVPEGIFNYKGKNTIALTVWSQEEGEAAAALDGVSLKAGPPVLSDRPMVKLVESPSWSQRENTY
ncbi:hypothetical protein N8T08_002520 [Aspergillus melleus]|uniref:Uncharacterized protein n=1 Tax=Aspergillus melleus TaxID=138277 RepID=A0ACC3B8R0_9EURO|nr:hypothetical protein N8T08_002520 [Aspergillus melleus]